MTHVCFPGINLAARQKKPREEGSALLLWLEEIHSFALARENWAHQFCLLFFLLPFSFFLHQKNMNAEITPEKSRINSPSGRHLVLLLFVIVKNSATGQLDGYKYSPQPWRPLNPAFLEAQWEPTEAREGAVKPSQSVSFSPSLPLSLFFSLHPGPHCGCEHRSSSKSALKIALGPGRCRSSKTGKMLSLQPALSDP